MQICRDQNDSSIFNAVLNGRVIGSCEACPDEYPGSTDMRIGRIKANADKLIHIALLDVDHEHQGKYIGTRLLYYVLRHFYRKGYRYARLYDASDRSGKKSCIYRRIGFRYVMEHDISPVMIGNIRHILYGKFRGMNGKNMRTDRFYRRNMIIPPI